MSRFVDFRYGEMEIFSGDPVISRSLQLYGEWAQNELDVLVSFIKDGDTILDIGTFIGTHAIAFSKFVGANGSVHCFEPRPEVFERLQRNLDRNRCSNVSPMLAAVGAMAGTLEIDAINVDSEQNFGGFSVNAGSSESSLGTTSVPCVTIDSLALTAIDFIKIDVEGMEPEVLCGAEHAISRFRPIMSIEANSLAVAVSILDFARKYGYKTYGLLFDAYNANNFLGEKNNIFGPSKEASLVLIPNEKIAEYETVIARHKLPPIDSADAAALVLIHKPQYAAEVLQNTAVSDVLGIDYHSPRARFVIDRLDAELNELKEKISQAVYEKSEAEQRLGAAESDAAQQVSVVQQNLSRTAARLEAAQAEAREFARQLEEIRCSHSWRVTWPLRQLSSLVKAILRKPRPQALAKLPELTKGETLWQEFYTNATAPSAAGNVPVDIIVPVYKGLDETRACIESVLNSVCSSRYELIVINDCSPEPEVTAWLRDVARGGEFTLLENPKNLGFVGTVNRGMNLHPDRDVVLLNSDALVANDWLDRLIIHAESNPLIGTITPFSTNATICSYPKFCEDNALPSGISLAELDAIFHKANCGYSVEVPTGVGFCMYIKRDLLDAIGLFDVERFGKGYGEENDFCQRAVEAGYKNVIACDTFVQHLGAVSFGAGSNPGKERAMDILRALHPRYERDVHSFIAQDPLWKYRLAASLARLRLGGRPVITHVLHSRGGGTLRHVEDLAEMQAQAIESLVLRPNGIAGVELTWARKGEDLRLQFDLTHGVDALTHALKTAGVSLVHFHHTIGLPAVVLTLPRVLEVPYRFTFHDYYSVCPQISLTDAGSQYCGEDGVDQCGRCLKQSGGGEDIIEWRNRSHDFLAGATELIAPSEDARERIARYFPDLNIQGIRHPEAPVSIRRVGPVRRTRNAIRVVVLGALSKIKGADVLEGAAIDAAARGLPIEFVLIGYAYRELASNCRSRLKVTGAYREEDLADIVAAEEPDLIWFPAVWPETYSYTLSLALVEGYAIAAPDIGAFSERVMEHPGGHILPWTIKPAEFNDWVLSNFDRFAVETPYFSRAGTRSIPEFYVVRSEAGASVGVKEGVHDSVFLKEASLLSKPTLTQGVREKLLEALRKIRVHPLCSWLVKGIPHNVQRRIRDRLVH